MLHVLGSMTRRRTLGGGYEARRRVKLSSYKDLIAFKSGGALDEMRQFQEDSLLGEEIGRVALITGK